MTVDGSGYRIRPGAGPLETLSGPYDLFICALGFEERSSYVARTMAAGHPPQLALMFDDDTINSLPQYEELDRLGADIVRVDDAAFETTVRGRIDALVDTHPELLRLAVDISSFSRPRLFVLLSVLASHSKRLKIDLDLLYAPAKVDPDLAEAQVSIESATLLAPELSGWGSDPSMPLAAIVGVGAERDLALGVAEYLEVAKIHAFVPTGINPEYDAIAMSANAEFFLADYSAIQNTYDLLQPDVLLTRLDTLIYGLAREFRIAIIPLGPKLFSACAILSALYSDTPTAVWRFSQGLAAVRRPTIAAGVVIRLPLTLEPTGAESTGRSEPQFQ